MSVFVLHPVFSFVVLPWLSIKIFWNFSLKMQRPLDVLTAPILVVTGCISQTVNLKFCPHVTKDVSFVWIFHPMSQCWNFLKRYVIFLFFYWVASIFFRFCNILSVPRFFYKLPTQMLYIPIDLTHLILPLSSDYLQLVTKFHLNTANAKEAIIFLLLPVFIKTDRCIYCWIVASEVVSWIIWLQFDKVNYNQVNLP
jgi:hypothetical protein